MDEKSMTDCIFFLKNQCKNGDNCEFRHSAEALVNFSPCNFWMKGTCTNAFCRFRHPARPSPAFTKPDPTKTSCFFYMNGGCAKGSACPFVHDPTTLPRGFNPSDGTPVSQKSSESRASEETEDSTPKPPPKKISSSTAGGDPRQKPSILARLSTALEPAKEKPAKKAAPASKPNPKKPQQQQQQKSVDSKPGLSMREKLKAQAAADEPAPDFGVKSFSASSNSSSDAPKPVGGAQMFNKALQHATASAKKRQREEQASAPAEPAASESASKRQKVDAVGSTDTEVAFEGEEEVQQEEEEEAQQGEEEIGDIDEDDLAGLDDDELAGLDAEDVEVPDDIDV